MLTKSTERIFRIPYLIIIRNCGKATTSQIMEELRSLLSPEGYDTHIISGRVDDYFSQKVRNVKSHSSLKGLVKYISKKDGWILTKDGIDFLDNNSDVVDEVNSILHNDSFNYYDKITFIDLAVLPFFPRRKTTKPAKHSTKVKKVIYYDENISEGKTNIKTVVVRERSRKLRDKAITHFTDNEGRIKCCICGYEFAKTYGDYGKGYIEIHHKKPVYQYEDKDIDSVLADAIDNLAPVCANCHRMLHHKKGKTFAEVKQIYDDENKIIGG